MKRRVRAQSGTYYKEKSPQGRAIVNNAKRTGKTIDFSPSKT